LVISWINCVVENGVTVSQLMGKAEISFSLFKYLFCSTLIAAMYNTYFILCHSKGTTYSALCLCASYCWSLYRPFVVAAGQISALDFPVCSKSLSTCFVAVYFWVCVCVCVCVCVGFVMCGCVYVWGL